MQLETAAPLVSLSNIVSLICEHGPVIGIVQQMLSESEQITLVFYDDGYVHTATGFACGVEGDSSAMLKMAVQLIPTGAVLAEGDILTMLGKDKKTKSALETGEPAFFVFRGLNRQIGFTSINDGKGMPVLDDYVAEIFTDHPETCIEVIDIWKAIK